MRTSVSTLTCAGCGAVLPDAARQPYPFRCAQADEQRDVDHLVTRTLDADAAAACASDRLNPFLRYRRFLHSYHLARERGLSDAQFVDLVTTLDEAIAAVDGRGFTITPFRRFTQLEAQLDIEPPGALWVKDETNNVSGSHKARHLMGVMLYLRVVEILGIDNPRGRGLAIASCGNAALAAAVVARAAGYPLRVFVPASAHAAVVDRIQSLGGVVEVCERRPGTAGDPSYLKFREAIRRGALPFCCQGSDNGLTIEGGETLGLEIAEVSAAPLNRLFVQVGGGALASSCIQAFADMRASVPTTTEPRVHAVQTCGAFPLKRAFDRVRERVVSQRSDAAAIDEAMRYARAHRSEFMWPWETEPHSIAHGILDDETYDWAAVVEGMLRTGGFPLVVDEQELRNANALARSTTGINVDHTGSAGLAGLIQLLRNDPSAQREQLAVIFSGVAR